MLLNLKESVILLKMTNVYRVGIKKTNEGGKYTARGPAVRACYIFLVAKNTA